MKNELDRQLKEQWEAARLSELNLQIDTEALWERIARPGKRNKFAVSWIKYAAAMLLGAIVSFGLMQRNKPGSIALQPGMNRQKVNERLITAQRATVRPNEMTGDVPVKPQPAPVYMHHTSGISSRSPLQVKTMTPTEAFKDKEEPVPENTNPAPAAQDKIVVVQTTKPQGRKTLHLLDLEAPAPSSPKPSKFMMAIEEHTQPKSNDIAFSTKILTKQF